MKSFKINAAPPLKGEAELPGDKSISHRAVLLSSISCSEVEVRNFLFSEDCLRTVECMRSMGIQVDEIKGGLKVRGKGLFGLKEPSDILYAGNSGTTIRLLLGILAGQKFKSTITGDDSIKRRPMDRVVIPLTQMGARIDGKDGAKFAPLSVSGGNLEAIEYEMPVPSAQVKSAILLAGLYSKGTTVVVEKVPTRDHTERMLEHFGADLKRQAGKISISGKNRLEADSITVPSDISSAAFIMVAAALIDGSDVQIRNVGVNPGRTGIIEVLHRMGADIEVSNERIVSGEPIADIRIRGSRLKAVKLSGSLIPRIIDEIPVIALAATQAEGETVISNAAELRVKESDRIATVSSELRKLGANIKELPDGLVVAGGARLKGSSCESFGDHRVAMSCAVGAMIARGETTINDVDCSSTSFPDFLSIMNKLSGRELIKVF